MTKKSKSNSRPVILFVVLGLFIFICIACLILFTVFSSTNKTAAPEATPTFDPQSATLTLAYSPEKADLIQELVTAFNQQKQRTSDRRLMRVELMEMPPDQMVLAALSDDPGFQALSPDASLWLDLLDLQWAEAHRSDNNELPPRRIAASARFAVSPIVIAAWPEVAQSLAGSD